MAKFVRSTKVANRELINLDTTTCIIPLNDREIQFFTTQKPVYIIWKYFNEKERDRDLQRLMDLLEL